MSDKIRAGQPGSIDARFQPGRDKAESPLNSALENSDVARVEFQGDRRSRLAGLMLLVASALSGFLMARCLDVIIDKHHEYLQVHVYAHGVDGRPIWSGPQPLIPVETEWSRLRAQMFGIPWVIALSCATASLLAAIFRSALPRNQRRLVWTTGLGAISGILFAFWTFAQIDAHAAGAVNVDPLVLLNHHDENRPVISGNPSQLGLDAFLLAYSPLIGIVLGYAICLVLEIREAEAEKRLRIGHGLQAPRTR